MHRTRSLCGLRSSSQQVGGAFQRRAPTGGAAKGIPLKMRTFESALTVPSTGPASVTTVSESAAALGAAIALGPAPRKAPSGFRASGNEAIYACEMIRTSTRWRPQHLCHYRRGQKPGDQKDQSPVVMSFHRTTLFMDQQHDEDNFLRILRSGTHLRQAYGVVTNLNVMPPSWRRLCRLEAGVTPK